MSSNCSFSDYTSSWIEHVKCLLNVSFLISNYGENIREVIVEKLRDNKAIQSTWDFLTRNVANKMFTEKLKIQILSKRSNIRTHAFVNTWVQVMRRK